VTFSYRSHTWDEMSYEVARQQVLHKRNRPFLQRFGKHSVVGVSERLLNNYAHVSVNIPCLDS
jgi:hypothetical protein